MDDLLPPTVTPQSKFDFPFTLQQKYLEDPYSEVDPTVQEQKGKSLLLFTYVSFVNQLADSREISNHTPMSKNVLSAFRSVFLLMKGVPPEKFICNQQNSTSCDFAAHIESSDMTKQLFSLNNLATSCIAEFEPESEVPPGKSFESFLDVLEIQEEDENYLLLLLHGHWQDFYEKHSNCLKEFTVCADLKHLVEFDVAVKERFGMVFGNGLRDDVKCLLMNLVRTRQQGALYAVDVLLKSSTEDSVTEILNLSVKNMVVFLGNKGCIPLVDAIVKYSSVENIKTRFLKLFYNVLSNSPVEEYNVVLKYILDHNYKTDLFRLPEFNASMASFKKKALSYDEAKVFLPRLLIQWPQQVIQTIFDEAVKQGEEGMESVKVLKHVSSACLHPSQSCFVVDALEAYFQKTHYSPMEMKNIVALIQTLMKVESEVNIISCVDFFDRCIFNDPNFENIQLVDLQLSCLIEMMRTLKDKLLRQSERFDIFMNLYKIIDVSISNHNARIKEMVIKALDELSKYQIDDGPQDFSSLIDFEFQNEITFQYLYKYSSYRCDKSDDIHALWTKSVLTQDISYFNQFVAPNISSYKDFYDILCPLFLAYTLDEWMHSALLVNKVLQSPSFEIACDSEFFSSKAAASIYNTVKIMMDAYHYLLICSSVDRQYVTNCLTNTVTFIKEKTEFPPEVLSAVFLDTCYIISENEDVLSYFSSFLMEMTKDIVSLLVKTESFSQQIKLLKCCVTGMTDFNEKSVILEHLQVAA